MNDQYHSYPNNILYQQPLYHNQIIPSAPPIHHVSIYTNDNEESFCYYCSRCIILGYLCCIIGTIVVSLGSALIIMMFFPIIAKMLDNK